MSALGTAPLLPQGALQWLLALRGGAPFTAGGLTAVCSHQRSGPAPIQILDPGHALRHDPVVRLGAE